MRVLSWDPLITLAPPIGIDTRHPTLYITATPHWFVASLTRKDPTLSTSNPLSLCQLINLQLHSSVSALERECQGLTLSHGDDYRQTEDWGSSKTSLSACHDVIAYKNAKLPFFYRQFSQLSHSHLTTLFTHNFLSFTSFFTSPSSPFYVVLHLLVNINFISFLF